MRGSKCITFFVVCAIYNVVHSDCTRGKMCPGRSHKCKSLTVEKMAKLAKLSDMEQFKNLLNPMMIERVAGTEENKKVQKHIIDHMERLNWEVELDRFTDNTPYGQKEFTNIIATLNPDAECRLVLACHFDSKLFNEFKFIGATDSAVPCAMLLDMAQSMDKMFQRWSKTNPKAKEVALQFVFFDGEEAFKKWTSTDSIYGARHLAEKWEKQSKEGLSMLKRISAFVLLDLIGTKKTYFRNWFADTSNLFERLGKIEEMLVTNEIIKKDNDAGTFFTQEQSAYGGGIEDDHIPFLHRRVPVLHLISFPFPKEWHNERDNEEALDYPTIDNLNKIMRIFVAEYLYLI